MEANPQRKAGMRNGARQSWVMAQLCWKNQDITFWLWESIESQIMFEQIRFLFFAMKKDPD